MRPDKKFSANHIGGCNSIRIPNPAGKVEIAAPSMKISVSTIQGILSFHVKYSELVSYGVGLRHPRGGPRKPRRLCTGQKIKIRHHSGHGSTFIRMVSPRSTLAR